MKKFAAKLILLGMVFSAHVACAFYDPSLGRWLNRDPLGEAGFDLLRGEETDLLGDGPNLYQFVGNAPSRWVDAFGNESVGSPEGELFWPAVQQCHKERNKHQKCPQNEPKGDPNWKPDKHNWGNTDPTKGHVGNCYRGPRGGPVLGFGGAQCCYVNGQLNAADPGTYDFVQPGSFLRDFGHGLLDWLPAKWWGN